MPKRSKTDGLSKAELKLIAVLLEKASDEFSNHGCNDYKIPATDEHKQIMLDMFQANGDFEERKRDGEVDEVMNAKDEIVTYDWWVMSYLADRCRKLGDKK